MTHVPLNAPVWPLHNIAYSPYLLIDMLQLLAIDDSPVLLHLSYNVNP